MSPQYFYLKLLLRNNLLLDLDEYALVNTLQKGLVCSFMDMKLTSVFQPIVRADGKVVGREALLRAGTPHGELIPQAAFDRAVRANRLVQFDRLVRITHLMNHARSFSGRDLLFLNVHPRLLGSVSDHGRTFEQILHYYSVPTSQVVIEIEQTAGVDEAVLDDAVSNYRSLGYRIAVDDFGGPHSSLEHVLRLRPDIVKLDGALVQTCERSPGSVKAFDHLVAKFRNAGIQVAVEGIESTTQLEIARRSGAELLQGHHLARPEFAPAKRSQPCQVRQLAA